MREKIAEIIGKYNPPSDNEAPIAIMYSDEECTDQILTLITNEIEKVENPTPISTRYDDPRYMDRLAHEYFEKCRQEILSLLRPKE